MREKLAARPIEFRFWHTEWKKWLKNCAVGEDGRVWDLTTNKVLENVIPLQSIGFKDKNGSEIFDGDVLRDPAVFQQGNDFRYVMEWDRWQWVVWDFDRQEQWKILSELDLEDLEVIGNIHENPELGKETA